MGILDNLESQRVIRPCRVRTVMNGLEADDVAKLKAVLADVNNWPAHTLYKSLNTLGISMSADAISRHRTGVCSCLKN